MSQEELATNKRQEIKREDKKSFTVFIIIIVIAAIIGFFLGMGSEVVKDNFAAVIADGVNTVLNLVSPFANVVLGIVSFVISMINYSGCKKKYRAWDGEDEEVYNKIDKKLSAALALSSVDMVLAFFFFAAGAVAIDIVDFDPYSILEAGAMLCWLGGFILSMVLIIIIQRLSVNLTKEMNPEKKGSIYDAKFAKKWEESCDEAEKLQIYKGGYSAYKAVNGLCIGLWLFCVIGGTIWNFGLMPVTMVSIIWLVQILSYTIGAGKK